MAHNPYKVVIDFEEVIAAYCGSKYAVAVESCTSALFLSLMWLKNDQGDWLKNREVVIPSRTYPGVACSIIHAGFKVRFTDVEWKGEYELAPLNIWDAALRFRKRMYHGGLQCLSFHIKKLLPIGRGGMILTDHLEVVKWLRRARFDGRNPVPLQDDHFDMLGWNCYMTPEQAARGLQLLQALGDRELQDLSVEAQGYPDLSKFPIYTQ
jgi:dTDP-4-amino-4,6-dideoxygalactose transaminase